MAYPSHQAYPGAPPPKKSSNRGCLIALAIVGSLGLLAVIGVAIAIYSIAQNEDVRKIASAVGEGMEIMKEAQTAPGTDELRKLGCDQALVLDMQRLAKLAEGFHDAGSSLPPDMPGKLVMCVVREISSAPTCEAASKAYLAAVPTPARRFAVTVETQKNKKSHCSEVYDPTGKSLGQFDKSAAPPVPSPEQ